MFFFLPRPSFQHRISHSYPLFTLTETLILRPAEKAQSERTWPEAGWFAILDPLTSKNNSVLCRFLSATEPASCLTFPTNGHDMCACVVPCVRSRSVPSRCDAGRMRRTRLDGSSIHEKLVPQNEMHVIVLRSGRFHKMNKQKRGFLFLLMFCSGFGIRFYRDRDL